MSTDQQWEDAYWASVDREMMEEAYKRETSDYGDSGFDGDACCPHCGSAFTVRIDLIGSDPDIWHNECAKCESSFDVVVSPGIENIVLKPTSHPSPEGSGE